MKRVETFNHWIKVWMAVLLALNLISILSPPTAAASEPLHQWSAETLYQQALSSEYNNNDVIHAAIYMFAYVQRNPPEYVNNYQGRKDFVDQKLKSYLYATNKAIELLKNVKSDSDNCKSSGGGGSELCNIFAETRPSPPPDAVLACTRPRYEGTCRLLFVGDYPTYRSLSVPNDSIASLMVGSRVKITLYANRLGDAPMITLVKDDYDLSNDRFGGKYPWSRNVSTAKVEWR